MPEPVGWALDHTASLGKFQAASICVRAMVLCKGMIRPQAHHMGDCLILTVILWVTFRSIADSGNRADLLRGVHCSLPKTNEGQRT